MEIIKVPKPDRSAFNKQRPPSDLLLSQLKYFQHLDFKENHRIDSAMAADVGTEAGAARYIAAMTTAIRDRALTEGKGTVPAQRTKPAKVKTMPRAAATGTRGGLRIAAAAASDKAQKPASSASAKKSSRAKRPKGV